MLLMKMILYSLLIGFGLVWVMSILMLGSTTDTKIRSQACLAAVLSCISFLGVFYLVMLVDRW